MIMVIDDNVTERRDAYVTQPRSFIMLKTIL